MVPNFSGLYQFPVLFRVRDSWGGCNAESQRSESGCGRWTIFTMSTGPGITVLIRRGQRVGYLGPEFL